MPTLDIEQVGISLSILGVYIIGFGLISFVVKERLYIGEPLVALLFGIVTGPIALKWLDPYSWTNSRADQDDLTFQITRIIVGIQLVFAGIALPHQYLKNEWKSLLLLNGPVMLVMYIVTSLLVWAMIPGIKLEEAMVIGACATPTDPLISNSIIKGRFADLHVTDHTRDLISAESGGNDGAGFPLLYLALYLTTRSHFNQNVGQSFAKFLYQGFAYEIGVSVVFGLIIGYVARKTLKFAEEREMVDHDSLLGYGLGLAFFCTGVMGLLGSDDVLSCFVAGNSFTWDNWFSERTKDHSIQDVLETVLNSALFIYIGAILDWRQFGNAAIGLNPWRLVVLAILVLILRRPPIILATYKIVPLIKKKREALFVGWFGPIGVGALLYLVVARRFIREVSEEDGDTIIGPYKHIYEVMTPTVHFLILASTIVHAVTIPFLRLRGVSLTKPRKDRKNWKQKLEAIISKKEREPIDRIPNNSSTTDRPSGDLENGRCPVDEHGPQQPGDQVPANPHLARI